MSTLIFFCPKCKVTKSIEGKEIPRDMRCASCSGPLFFESEQSGPGGPGRVVTRELTPGQRFGDFEVLERLGTGGMGVVYKAMNLSLKRVVALKVLRPDFTTDEPDHVRRFEREAQAAAQLVHPNIVTIFSIGKNEGQHYIEMEYVDGPSAGDLAERSGPMDVRLALKILRDAARGLAAAHRQKIVHRDIKPDNILIHPDGLAKVADFGLAKPFGPGTSLSGEMTSDLTQFGIAIGTPHFMSPEQCEGAVLDGRSDIYSLGCTFYYLLTGSRPYRGKSTMSIMRQHLFDPAPDVTLVRPDIPEDVAAIALKLMAKDRAQRYASAEELLQDIDALSDSPKDSGIRDAASGAPVTDALAPTKRVPAPSPAHAAEAKPPVLSQEWHLPLLYGILAFAVAAVVVAAVLIGVLGHRSRPSPQPGPSTSTVAPSSIEPDDASVPGSPDTPGVVVVEFKTTIYDLDLEPRSRTLAVAGDDAYVHICGLTQRKEAKKLSHSPQVRSVRFSSSGQYLASAGGSILKFWSGRTFDELATKPREGVTYYALSFSRNGSRLAAGSSAGIELWDVSSGTLVKTLKGGESPVGAVAFGPTAQTVVAGDARGVVYFWADVEMDTLPRRLETGHSPILSADVSQDLRWIAATTPDYLVLVDRVSQSPEMLYEDPRNAHLRAAISREGDFLALGRDDGRVAFLDFKPQPLARPERFHGRKGGLGAFWFEHLRFSSCGEWLMSACHDGSITLYPVREIRKLFRAATPPARP